jgi:hypothetical protein
VQDGFEYTAKMAVLQIRDPTCMCISVFPLHLSSAFGVLFKQYLVPSVCLSMFHLFPPGCFSLSDVHSDY